MLGACLVAMFAIAAVAAAAQAAETPTWYECAKAPHSAGNFSNKTCTEASAPGKGKYELKEGIGKNKPFKGSDKTAKAVLNVKTWLPDQTVDCTGIKDSGKLALPNLEKEVEVTYSNCTALGNKCSSAGVKKEGEIHITGLKGELGYVEESPTVVGLKLENEATPGGTIVEFNCKVVTAAVAGEVIGTVGKDVNTISKESELVDEATERYGEHEFEDKKYKPLVNIVGWANEVGGIIKAEEENNETSDPAHVLKGQFCGELIEELLHVECTPPAYAGLDQTIVNKGESLMIKAA